MTPKYRIIIADDHPIFRKGLREIIESAEQWQVIAEAATGEEALLTYHELCPDILVLDISMADLSGIDVAEKILAHNKDACIVIMTMYKEAGYCQRALSLGVKGYLVKDDATEAIIECLDCVMTGQHYVSNGLGGYVEFTQPRQNENIVRPEGILTRREIDILIAIAALKTNKEIAKELHLSLRTVQNHRQNMSVKLNLSGRQALLQFAVKWAEANQIRNTN